MGTEHEQAFHVRGNTIRKQAYGKMLNLIQKKGTKNYNHHETLHIHQIDKTFLKENSPKY